MEIAVLLVSVFVVLLTLGVVATVKAARAVGRKVEQAGVEARRGIDDTVLKVKAAQPGPVGQLARTRLELRSSLDSARRELESAAVRDSSLAEALGLLDRLHDHARELDRELGALMTHEPDRARIATRLPEARAQMAAIKQSADSLRHAAQDRARRYDADGLDSLREQIAIESGALRHWTPPDTDSGAELGEGAPPPKSLGQPRTEGTPGSTP